MESVPDVIRVGVDPKKTAAIISVGQARELHKQLMVKPFHARRRFVIFDPADAMTPEAANALLKTFEDPPSQTHFVLITGAPASLLMTVRSRSQRIRFAPVKEDVLVAWLTQRGVARSRRQVGGLTMATGIVVFIESNLSVLTAGIFARGLFDKFGMSRARLAYLIDSTSAPVCILILLNGWGAFVLGMLDTYDLPESSASILWGSVPFNFYAIIALAIAAYTVFADKVHGPMAKAEQQLSSNQQSLEAAPATKASYMVVPIVTMVVSMVGFMLWTGNGVLAQGSGSKSVLYATILATAVAYLMLVFGKRFTHHEAVETGFKGMGEILPLVTIVLLSLTLGSSLKVLGTGVFVAGLVGEYLPVVLVVPMLFIAGAIMSFTTGTSWGTFAILIPIGVPLIQQLGLPPSLVIGAILGGGVFGDHCSPISDTTAVSSIASGCDLLEHVRTQLPYALVGGGLTLIAYLITSIIMVG